MNLHEIITYFGAFTIFIFFICGIDDTIWNLMAMFAYLFRKPDKDDVLDFSKLRNTPPKMLAVSIAAWHEANVIRDVINAFINNTDYPRSMYHLFVGVYPNDPETIAAVKAVSEKYPNIHAVINCADGPTTKAQNLNHVIRQIKLFEKKHNIRFASLTVHDSEDVIHTYELLATNYLIDKHNALQFPVFPIIEMPTFRNFFKQLTSATYADEFAENHYITLIERKIMGAFVPCAGTGFVLSRSVIEKFEGKDVLPSNSLTEDYALSLLLYKQGISLYYVRNRILRVMKNRKIKKDFITTRSLFPSTFSAAVRQKSRWTYGITMQSIGLKDVFRSKGVSFAGRYSFFKDAKTKLINIFPIIGYIASVYCLVSVLFDTTPLYTKGSVVYYMSIIVFIMMCIRQILRGYALYHVYGIRSVFFGCLLPPIFPIRLLYGNIINFAATMSAIRIKINGGKINKKKEKDHKTPVKWNKTEHDFLTQDQLVQYKRMMGDMLIVQGCLTAKQFHQALNDVAKNTNEYIGDYLVRRNMITEEQMVSALSYTQHVLFIPNQVAEKIDVYDLLKKFNRKTLLNDKILPLAIEGDTFIIGICDKTTEESIEKFSKKNKMPIQRMYMMGSEINKILKNNKRINKRGSILTDKNNGLCYEQAMLILIYSILNNQPEQDIRQYMGC